MQTTFPGMTVETSALSQGGSRALFDGIFAAGGITLSQVSIMTGLEPYLIQNWVKRGFLTSPKKRVYSRKQFARIVIINMLRESLQLERICSLISIIGGDLEDESDDLIGDDELYHRYVDMLASGAVRVDDAVSVAQAARMAAASFEERLPHTRQKLEHILQVMVYAHAATEFRRKSEEILIGMN